MNALDRKFMNVGKSMMAARFLGVAAVAALLSGCVTNPVASAKVDPNSPIAAEVAKLTKNDRDYPTFSEIPPAPTDLRPVQVYGQRAQTVVAARDRLQAATAPNTWALTGNTTAFAAGARRAAGPDLGPSTAADTEAFANAVRKRATPPPPANR